MNNNIDPVIFIISLTIGLLITYLLLPSPKVIIKYPNLHNIDKVKYIDNVGKCYQYDKKIVKCN